MSPQLDERRLPVNITPENARYVNRVPPGIMEKIYNYFSDSPLPDPGMMTAPGLIALNKKTLPIFEKAMQEAYLSSTSATGNRLLDQVMAFVKTRWPRFSSQVPTKSMGNMEGIADPNTLGEYFHKSIVPQPNIRINPIQTQEEMANTVTHELTHALQDKRWSPYDIAWDRSIPYRSRPSEKLANKGGAVGEFNFQKLVDLIQEARQQQSILPQRYPVTRQNLPFRIK